MEMHNSQKMLINSLKVRLLVNLVMVTRYVWKSYSGGRDGAMRTEEYCKIQRQHIYVAHKQTGNYI